MVIRTKPAAVKVGDTRIREVFLWRPREFLKADGGSETLLWQYVTLYETYTVVAGWVLTKYDNHGIKRPRPEGCHTFADTQCLK